MKMHYIDRLDTKLCKANIEERLKDMILEDKYFNIHTKGKKLCRAKFSEDKYSFFYLSNRGNPDMLSPRIYMTILEKKEGCICNLFYSRTWEFLCLFLWWSFFGCVCIYVSISRSNVFSLICYMAVYILGIWIAKKHYINICKKVVSILRVALLGNDF